jgi:hypothetical protein
MGLFGWDLPPGCRACDLPGGEPDPPCEICGKDVDSCICPECPVCFQQGAPECYNPNPTICDKGTDLALCDHPSGAHCSLVRTQAQIDSLAQAEAEWKDMGSDHDGYDEA